jgi:hypothetical protein
MWIPKCLKISLNKVIQKSEETAKTLKILGINSKENQVNEIFYPSYFVENYIIYNSNLIGIISNWLEAVIRIQKDLSNFKLWNMNFLEKIKWFN